MSNVIFLIMFLITRTEANDFLFIIWQPYNYDLLVKKTNLSLQGWFLI